MIADLTSLAQLVEDKKAVSPGGAESVFIPINDKWAIKIIQSAVLVDWNNTYDDDEMTLEVARDIMYGRQKAVAELGYAPEVGDKINLPDGTFGYITEIVEAAKVPPADFGYQAAEEFNNADPFYCEYLEANKKGTIEIIIDEIEAETSWRMTDSHGGNWGRKNGQWVVIDFGCAIKEGEKNWLED